MAQVTGDSPIDFLALRKHRAALRVMQRASDCIAADDAVRCNAPEIAAVCLRLYLEEWNTSSSFDVEDRPFEEWLALVASPLAEITRTNLGLPPNLAERIVRDLEAELRVAVQRWRLGDPEDPATATAVNVVEHLLFAHHVWHRPSSPALPTSLQTDRSVRGDV